MQSLWLCWVLWALALAGCGAAVTEEQILVKLLQQLQLSRAPVLDNVDVETMAIPAHVRAQYVSLLHRSHGDRSRGKRFSQNFRGELFLLALVSGKGRLTMPTLDPSFVCISEEQGYVSMALECG